ncbi:PPOX class F420-dependent oxidoreductase [Prauserella coralliicola]|nr:PPOX class F420-dependent oxidoreductase [Prauserella coralliicola]
MRLDEREARRRFAAARVARLATVGPEGAPHLVPVTFAVVGDTVAFVIDAKPKSTTNLRRLRNIAANPNVSFLVDHYDDDWSRLWWVRADGAATVVPEDARMLAALRDKYPQYVETPPEGPLVRAGISAWRGWSARP